MPKSFQVETVPIESLKPHPRNYREHPDDQLTHLQASLKQFGFYRNIVIAKDGTILAGHGIVKAAKKRKLKAVPVIRLNVQPGSAAALKVLIGDNEIEHLAEQNDRLLTELLKEVKDQEQLLGTGFDEKALAAFLMVTRPASEIQTLDEAAHWVGMPEFESGHNPLKLVVSFRNKKDRKAFAEKLGVELGEKAKTLWYPPAVRGELGSETTKLKFK